MDSRAMLTVRLLGGASIEGDAGPLTGPAVQRHRLALLAVLAAAYPRGVGREKVMGLLWPERDTEHARNLVKQAVHVLRRALGEAAILSVGEELRLDPLAVRVDIIEFEEALAAGDLNRAVRLHGGTLLDGFFLPDALEFERWLDGERRRLRRAYLKALEHLAEKASARGDRAEAAEWWRRLAGEEPYNARVTIRLMEALEAAGDRAGAIHEARLHAERLHDELEAEPNPAVAGLAERMRKKPSPKLAVAERTRGKPTAAREAPSSPAAGFAPPGGNGGTPGARPAGRSLIWLVRERRAGFLTLATIVLMVLAGAAWLAGRRGAPASESGIAGAGSVYRLLVADFANVTSDSLLGDLVSDVLRVDLARSPVLEIAGTPTVADALLRMRRDPASRLDAGVAREVAEREGIGAVIYGEVHEASGYVISAAMMETATGKTVDGWRVTARDSMGLIEAVDRLSTEIRRDVGEAHASIEATAPLFHATTASLEALRTYSVAGRAYHRGDFLHAAALLEEVIRLDSAFARAHYLLAASLSATGGRRSRALDAVVAAYRLRDRLPAQERHAVTARYHLNVVGDLPEAIAAYRNQIEAARGTGELALYASLSRSLAMAGDWVGAEAVLQEAREVYPTAVNQAALAKVLYRQGKWRKAADVLQDAMTRYPGHPLLGATRVRMVAASGDLGAADSLARDLPPGGGVGVAHRLQALTAALRGRIRDAIDHLRAQQGQLLSVGLVAEAGEVAVAIARLRTLEGERAAALAGVEEFLARYPLDSLDVLDRPYLPLARFFADAGRAARAGELLAAYEREVPREYRGPSRWSYLRTRAAVRLAEGDPNAGRADLERAGREPAIHYESFDDPSLSLDERPELARAYDRSGEPDAAISTYERYLAARSLDRTELDAFELPVALLRLAELYEAGGDRAAAARHYLRFAELWRDADARLQPRVDVARRRAAPASGP